MQTLLTKGNYHTLLRLFNIKRYHLNKKKQNKNSDLIEVIHIENMLLNRAKINVFKHLYLKTSNTGHEHK